MIYCVAMHITVMQIINSLSYCIYVTETNCSSLFLELHAASNSSSTKTKDRGRAHAHHAKICT